MKHVPIVEIKINYDSPEKKEKFQISPVKKNKEVKENLSYREADTRNKKIIKIQQDNLNGNYGKVYVKESPNRYGERYNLSDKKSGEKPVQPKEIKKIYSNTNNNNNYNNNINTKKRRIISVGNRYERKIKEDNDKMEKCDIRKTSIERGGDYKNIRTTHIIYSTKKINFHIINPLMSCSDEMRKKYMHKVDARYKNGKNGKVKVSYNSSCDNIFLKTNKKVNLNGKVTVVSHRQNVRNKTNINTNINNNIRDIKKTNINTNINNNNIRDIKKTNKERKEGKEGKDSTIKMKMRNKKRTVNKANNEGSFSASYKKRNEKNYNNKINNINAKKIK